MKVALWVIAVPVILVLAYGLSYAITVMFAVPFFEGFEDGSGVAVDPVSVMGYLMAAFAVALAYLSHRLISKVSRRPVS